tara:strand:- start:299 stop:436 length:138 start_codon:yes stop_codon:yes gene_type:complete
MGDNSPNIETIFQAYDENRDKNNYIPGKWAVFQEPKLGIQLGGQA